MPNQGNALYLVCEACQKEGKKDFGIRIAARPTTGFYETEAPQKQVGGWLWKHSRCTAMPDHFRLGMLHPSNHDQSPTNLVTEAISTALKT